MKWKSAQRPLLSRALASGLVIAICLIGWSQRSQAMGENTLELLQQFTNQKLPLNWWNSPAQTLPVNTMVWEKPYHQRKVASLAGVDLSNLMPLPQKSAFVQTNHLSALSYLHTQAARLRFEPAKKPFDQAFSRASNLDSFMELRAALRASPDSWLSKPKIQQSFAKEVSEQKIEQLMSAGVSSFLVANSKLGQWGYFSHTSNTKRSWGRRWSIWSYYYLMSYWLAKNYEIVNIELDDSGKKPKVHFWSNAFSVAADAIHTAISDVNNAENKQLDASIAAPGSEKNYFTDVRLPGNQGVSRWGEQLFLRNQKPRWKHKTSEYDQLFQVFAYQHFRWDKRLSKNLQSLEKAMKKHGEAIPVMLSRINAISSNHAAFYETDTHDPMIAGWFTEALIRLMKFNFHKGGYFISDLAGDKKIKQPPGYDKDVLSNLNYLMWSEQAPAFPQKKFKERHYGGITRSGEALRLINKACPSNSILFESHSNLTGVTTLACKNMHSREYHLLLVNNSNQMHTIRTRIPWDAVKPGDLITSTDISNDYAGQPTSFGKVPWGKKISTPLLSQSIKLLSFPDIDSKKITQLKPRRAPLLLHQDTGQFPHSLLLRQQGQRQMLYLDFAIPKGYRASKKIWLKIKGSESAATDDHVLHVYQAQRLDINSSEAQLDFQDPRLEMLLNHQLSASDAIDSIRDIQGINGLGINLPLIGTFQVEGERFKDYWVDLSDMLIEGQSNYQLIVARVPRKRYQSQAEPAWQQQRFRYVPDSIRLIAFK